MFVQGRDFEPQLGCHEVKGRPSEPSQKNSFILVVTTIIAVENNLERVQGQRYERFRYRLDVRERF
jgi:hypothetical protein